MEEEEILARLARADALLRSTAEKMKELLHKAAQELTPFPQFMESWEVKGIEAEPTHRRDLGCVILCPDGELYEYTYNITVGPFATGVDRQENAKKLDLPPQDYIPYAYNALSEVTRLLKEKVRS